MSEILFNKIQLGSGAIKGLQLGSALVKFCKLGSSLIYDTFSHYIYDTPTITVTYPTLSRNGGSVTPTVKYTQKRTKVGYSGQQYSSDTISGTVTSFTASGSAVNSSGATIISTTGVVSRDSLGTTLKNSEWNIMNVTISATINGKSSSGSATVKMQSNTVVSYAYSDPVLNISNNLTAAGGYVDVTSFIVSRTPTYQTTSVGAKETGINVTANATYTYTGTRFTRSGLKYNHDNMTTNIATDTLSITATYEGQSNTKTASVSNSRSLVSVYLVPYQPDGSWAGVSGSGSSATWNTVSRTGGYIQAKAYANYSHTSGTPLNDQKITDDPCTDDTLKTTLTWSDNFVTRYINGVNKGYMISTRNNTISNTTRTSTATFSYTYNGTTRTTTKSITQQSNMIKSVALNVSAGAIDKSGTASTMRGDISITNSTSPSCSGTATLEAGSCSITLSTYGTLTGPSYSWSENTDYTTITGNGATATLTFGENMTLSDRSATVTRTASYSYSINSAYLASGGTQTSNKSAQTTVSVSQSKGYYTYSNPYNLSCTYGNVTAVGGSSSPSISYKQDYGWNGRTSGVGTITGGSSDDGYTTYSISKTCTGLSINSDTGVVTWAKNNATSEAIDSQRYGEVTMTVTRNKKTAELSGIKTTQLGEAVSSYGNWTFNVTLGTPNIAASGGSSTITISRPTRTVTLNTGDEVEETASTGSFAVTSSNSSFTLDSANKGMTSSGVPSFTVSVGGAGAVEAAAINSTIKVVFTSTNPTTGTTTSQVSKTVTRTASVYSDHEFRFSQFDGLTTSINAAAKSMTLTMVVQRRNKYTGSSNWAGWNNIAPADGSIVLTCSNATSSAVSEGTSSNSYKSTSTISISANQISDNYTTSARTITVSGKYTNGSKSCTSSTITINQSADAISSYGIPTAPVIGSGLTAGGGSASLSTASTVTNTYVSGNKLAGSVSYILETSTFTNSSNSTSNISRFSVDGSTGKVTHTTMGTNVGTDKVSVIARNTGDTSKTATSNTISISNAAMASFSGITITSFTYSGDIPAGGGQITPSVSYTQTPYYTSGSAGTAITKDGTLTYTIANSRFTLDGGKVTGGNRTTNIGNEITDTITVKVVLNKKEATKTVTVKQLGNYVTGIAVKSHTFSYDNIGAGATASGNPKCASTPEYTFSSGSKSTTTPSTTYGTLSSSASYSIANKTTNGFTNINQTSGVLTATSRGANYGASARSSAQVTRTLTYTWTPTSSYNSAGTKTGSGNAYATCAQNANIFTSAAWTNISGGAIGNPGTYSAGGQTKKVTNSTSPSASVTLTLSSGSKIDSGTYGVISGPTYSWSSNQTYATLTSDNKSELNVAMGNRLASTGSARQATITRNATFTFALKSDYKEVSSCALSKTVPATVTITQEANAENAYYRYKEMVVQLSNNLTAGGGYATPSVTATKVGYYTSGSEGASTTVNIVIDDKDTTVADTEWFSTSDSATSGSAISRFNWNTTNKRYNHLSMGINEGYDYLYVVVTNTSYTWLDSKTAKSNTVKVYNGIVNTLGGVTTYGTLTAGTITNKTISASGTTTAVTATAGNGSQTYSTTRKYYLYTSGSEKTISEATSGSVTISPNIASISATASSKGVVTSGVTEVKKQAVTWASKDGDTSKDKAGIMYIYQAANAITGYSLPQPTGIKWNALIPAKGGAATPTINQVKQLYSYTSGASQWVNVSPSISYARAQAVHGTDPEFYNGVNSIYLYDNNQSGKTTLTRVTSGIPSGCPNNSGVAYKISNTGSGTQPGLGGFYFGYAGASGQTYIMTFDAWVPSGYSLAHAYNSLGSGGSQQALTPMNGCGEWRTYSIQVYFGTSNSSAFFIYLSGTAGTSSSPVNWYVANAKICKVSNVSATTPTFNTSTGIINVGTRGTTQGVTGIADSYASLVAVITANGQSSKVVLAPSQQANNYSDSGGGVTYGNWEGGKVTSSKTSLNAGEDSCTIYIAPWKRIRYTAATIRTWTSEATQTIVAASQTDDYYTGSVTLSENGSYTSLSATSYTANKDTKSVTLNKSSCSTSTTSAATITVTATGPITPAEEAKCRISQQANVANASYDNPIITGYTYSTFARGGAILAPTITYKQTPRYTSGSAGTDITGSYSSSNYNIFTYNYPNNNGFTLTNDKNSPNHGKMTAANNNSETARTPSPMPKVQVTLNGKTSNWFECKSCTQTAGQKEYGDWSTGSVTATKSSLGVGSDSCTINITSWTRSWGWNAKSGGGTDTYTGTVNVSMSGNNSYITLAKVNNNSYQYTLSKTSYANNAVGATTVIVYATGPNTASVKVNINENKITNYGSWTGTLSLNSTSNLSAAADSRTVTYGKVYRTNTYTTGSTKDEYYSGTVYVTCSGSNYVSLSSSNYSNSGSTTTTTLNKTSYGQNVISQETISIALRLGSSTGTSVASTNIKTTANVEQKNVGNIKSYGYPTITKTSDTISASGGSCSFTIGNPINVRYYYHTYTSGDNDSATAHEENVTGSYSGPKLSNTTRFLLNGNTVYHDAMGTNTGIDECTITVTNAFDASKSASIKVSATNSRNTVEDGIVWNNPNISLTNDTLSASGGSATVSYSQSGVRYYHYEYTCTSANESKNARSESKTGSVSINMTTNGNNRFTLSGNNLTHRNMLTDINVDTVVITATGSGNKTNTVSKDIINQIIEVNGIMDRFDVPAHGGIIEYTPKCEVLLTSGEYDEKNIYDLYPNYIITTGADLNIVKNGATVTIVVPNNKSTVRKTLYIKVDTDGWLYNYSSEIIQDAGSVKKYLTVSDDRSMIPINNAGGYWTAELGYYEVWNNVQEVEKTVLFGDMTLFIEECILTMAFPSQVQERVSSGTSSRPGIVMIRVASSLYTGEGIVNFPIRIGADGYESIILFIPYSLEPAIPSYYSITEILINNKGQLYLWVKGTKTRTSIIVNITLTDRNGFEISGYGYTPYSEIWDLSGIGQGRWYYDQVSSRLGLLSAAYDRYGEIYYDILITDYDTGQIMANTQGVYNC